MDGRPGDRAASQQRGRGGQAGGLGDRGGSGWLWVAVMLLTVAPWSVAGPSAPAALSCVGPVSKGVRCAEEGRGPGPAPPPRAAPHHPTVPRSLAFALASGLTLGRCPPPSRLPGLPAGPRPSTAGIH